jgi:hypothetical protein
MEKYPKLKDVAAKVGCSVKTVKNRAALMRKAMREGKNAVKLISRAEATVPMSENEALFREDWTAEDCIEELLRIAKIDPDKVVTRNYFRVHSDISESTWNRYFGTFEEFKRQAGVKLSRQVHALEREIAKHASVDHYRRLADDRKNYADSYLRPHGGRFQTIMVCSDLHDVEIDPFFLRVWLETVARVQPDIVSFVGDVMDLPEFGKYGVDPREWDVVGRIKFAHDKIFRPTRMVAPEAQIDYIEGNHEARMLRHLADATPAMRAILSDLHGFTVPKLLGLDEFEMNYIAKGDLAAYSKRDFERELGQNYKVYFDCFMAHHFPHARQMGMPGVNGHHHRHIVWSEFNPMFGAYEWHQLGCGHKRAASYCEGEKWHTGFAIVNIDTHTKAVQFDYVQVGDEFAVSGGKWYTRHDDERYLAH